MGEQAVEAAVGPSVLVVLAGGLGLGGSRAASGGEGVCLGGRVLAGVGQRRPCLAQVPGQVGGEHADQHVGFDALSEPVEDRAQVQVAGLDVAEVPLGVFEVLVRGDDAGRVELAGRDGGRST